MFEKMFEYSPIATILIDGQFTIKLLNHETENLFGYNRGELIGKTVDPLIPIENRSDFIEWIKIYFDTSHPSPLESNRKMVGVHKNGNSLTVEVDVVPIETPEGLWVMVKFVDLSFKLAQEEKFRTVLEASPIAMIIVNQKRVIIFVNRSAEKLFGYQREELLDQHIEIVVPDNVKDHHSIFVNFYIERPEPRAMGTGRDLYGKRKDGVLIPVEVGLCPVKTEEGLIVVSSIVDISQRVKDKELLIEQKEEIQQLTYRASHDLRSPLISIHGLSGCIEEDINGDNRDEIIKNCRRIKDISIQLLSLVDDIQELVKKDEKTGAITTVDFSQLFGNCQEKWKILSQQKGVELVAHFGHHHSLQCDYSLLQQVLNNLISNAIQFSDPQKDKRFVCIKTFNDSHSFYIQVQDNGLGIPQDKQNEVFNLFKHFHRMPTYGSGLGLYLVKKGIEKLGGKINFESDEKGSVFYIQFPLR